MGEQTDGVNPAAASGPGEARGAVLIDQVADWLMDRALDRTEMEALIAGCCQRLHGAGVSLVRAHVAFRTLHPVLQARGFTWHRGGGVETTGFRHDVDTGLFARSPHHHMLESGVSLFRRRLTGDEALLDFDVLSDLKDAGGTDYLAYIVAFETGSGDGIIGSWASDRPGGFSDGDIRALLRIQRRLAVAYKVAIKERIAQDVLAAYLGPEAGARVLSGQIRLGDHERIHAVIWLSDLRRSTALAAALPTEDYLAALNGYFDCTAGAVLEAGGEVLLLLGDAVLAIFRTDQGAGDAAERALAAAAAAEARLRALNAERAGRGEAALAFGIGLHVGDVVYGNIGVAERLQFTVTGAAVNEVARLEALTKELERPVLASGAFAELVKRAWEQLGRHQGRGLPTPIEVLAPPAAG